MNNIIKSKKVKPLNKKNLEKLFLIILSMLDNIDFLKKYVISEKSFSRDRKLPLSTMVKLLFSRVTVSISIFLSIHFSSDETVSKQAFSKSRKNINPLLFFDLNKLLIEERYTEYKLKLYKNKYLLFSIDGSTIEIPNTDQLREIFGHTKGQKGAKEIARASISCIYDSINNMVITSSIEKYNTPERDMAINMVNEIKNIETFNDHSIIYIMDRGYYSKNMLLYMVETQQKFLFRLKKTSLKKYFTKMKTNDEWIEVVFDKNIKLRLRFTKVLLKSGEIEYLLSNVDDVAYEEMKQLYYYRWPIEENYKFIKSRLQIENFSGKSEITIKQDFYSGILNGNINYLIQEVCEKKETEKHIYKANKNNLVGVYKEYISKKILSTTRILIKGLRKVISLVSYHLIMESSPERSFKRNMDQKVRANRFYTNLRPN